MNNIKKAGIVAGAVTGGLIGGTVSLAGKLTKIKLMDELGEGIVDSALLTGEILGEAVSGTTDMLSGGVSKDRLKLEKGRRDLSSAAGKTVANVTSNIKDIGSHSSEILKGVKSKDGKRVMKGFKTLGKMAVIGFLTVGAIKINKKEEKEGGSE
jgi:hypothetical protein